jgi:hypothetical protein
VPAWGNRGALLADVGIGPRTELDPSSKGFAVKQTKRVMERAVALDADAMLAVAGGAPSNGWTQGRYHDSRGTQANAFPTTTSSSGTNWSSSSSATGSERPRYYDEIGHTTTPNSKSSQTSSTVHGRTGDVGRYSQYSDSAAYSRPSVEFR